MPSNRSSYIAILSTCVLLVAWSILANFVVPSVVVDAYHGESIALVNGVISGQDEHSVEKYLDDWRQLAKAVSIVVGCVGALAFILLRSELHDFVDARWPIPPRAAIAGRAPSKLRKKLVHSIMVAIVGLSTYAIARPVELWPFSPYPMYAGIRTGRSVRTVRVNGVLADGSGETSISDIKFLHPWDIGRLRDALVILKREKQGDRVAHVLRNTLDRYERRRQAGQHSGPKLKGVRLYDVRWKMDPEATNRSTPDTVELIAEALDDANRAQP